MRQKIAVVMVNAFYVATDNPEKDLENLVDRIQDSGFLAVTSIEGELQEGIDPDGAPIFYRDTLDF